MIIDIILLVWLHFFADFVCQTDKQALNKSSSNAALNAHIFVYTVVLALGVKLAVGAGAFASFRNPAAPALYAIVNGAIHWVTDYFTSRWSKALWEKQHRHEFFVVVGLDQALHATALLATYAIAALDVYVPR